MRHLALLAPLLFLHTPIAQAQLAETVTVNEATLTGLWKIAVPNGFSINLAQHVSFLPMKNIFCRITQSGSAFDIHCINRGYSRSGSGTISGNKVHIAWGSMMARMVIDGMRSGSDIDGHFAFKLSGISHEDSEPSHSERLAPPIAGADRGGKEALLKAVLEGRPVPRDNAAILKNGGTTNPETLGAVQVVAYLGQSPRLGGGADPEFFTVYAVEFDNGERLCGLHQRDDGTLDAFHCV